MERFVLSGEKSRGTAGAGIDSGIPVRLPLSGCFIRKLAGAGGCLAVVAALGAYLGILGFGLENDIYFQIGLVTLIGLAAKNAILIVEFAKMEVDKGVDVVVAAKNAAMLRFRPILMTSLAFVLGMLPLVMASGPGSASRHSIGTGVFFGMIAAITIGIVLVPFFFVMVYKFKEKIRVKTKSVK